MSGFRNPLGVPLPITAMHITLYDDELLRRFGAVKVQAFKVAQREARLRLTQEGYALIDVYEAMVDLIGYGVLTCSSSATYKITKALLDGRVRLVRRAS